MRGKTVGIVVARMGSSRVPGKSLLDLGGAPVIERILQNVGKVKGIEEVCLATSSLAQDDPIELVANRCAVRCVRGHPELVLDRLFQAATEADAKVIVEIGGDCPFIGPDVLEHPISQFHDSDFDYLCNYEPPTYPEGFDINIISMAALTLAFHRAIAPSQRIHPFSYLSFHRDQFKIGNIELPERDLSRFHWSLDFPEDVEFMRLVFESLGRPSDPIPIADIEDLIRRDEKVRALHLSLLRPPAEHAFWNAPAIIRDMNNDLRVLADVGREKDIDGDDRGAMEAYAEIVNIATELKRRSNFKSRSA